MTTSRCAARSVQADRRADAAPDRPVSRPRRRRPHLPRQCVRDAAATSWSASTAAISTATRSATDGLNFQKLKTQNVAGTIEYDFGPVTLYSVTSYWHGKLKSRGDIDGGFGCTAAFRPSGPVHSVPGAEPGQYPEPRPVHPGTPHRVEQQRRPRLPGRHLLLRRKSRHRDLRLPAARRRPTPDGDRQPAPGQPRRSASSARSTTSSTAA